ncbi:MAG: hypothetical protein KAX50_03005 [Saprospiraceae bacterium]|nr:hypothetical protein [Saprospiraceae bacterium]
MLRFYAGAKVMSSAQRAKGEGISNLEYRILKVEYLILKPECEILNHASLVVRREFLTRILAKGANFREPRLPAGEARKAGLLSWRGARAARTTPAVVARP